MSGSRAKALRRAVTAAFGRPPWRADTERYKAGLVRLRPPARNAKGRVVERFLRYVYDVRVLVPSEWRQAKKTYLAQRSR